VEETALAASRASVLVVADDLIWASRLTAAVDRAGARSQSVRSAEGLAGLLSQESGAAAVIVDLGGRAYDGVEAVRAAAAAGAAVLAVAQHDDRELRRRALAAGALRVLSYNKLFNDGPSVVAALLEGGL
jgi:DNA-binding NarL/FixJ family response regulator